MKLPFENPRAYWASIGAAVVLVGALGYHVICGEHGYLALRREQRQYRTLKQHVLILQQQNEDLQKHIEALKNDPATIEKQAREQLRLAKPGEIIYTLPDKPSKDQDAVKEKTPPAPQ